MRARSNGNVYIVKGLRMMEELVRAGFNVHFVEDDVKNPEFKVFGFVQTDELLQEITRISNQLNKYRQRG